jgi:hypothetical protein
MLNNCSGRFRRGGTRRRLSGPTRNLTPRTKGRLLAGRPSSLSPLRGPSSHRRSFLIAFSQVLHTQPPGTHSCR